MWLTKLNFVHSERALVNLQVSTFVSSHSPELWTNPEEFNPYRFDDEELVKRYVYTNL